MNSSITASRARRGLPTLAPAQARERSIRRRVGITWGLLVVDGLTYAPGSVLHIPSAGWQLITQGALPVALIMALTVNPRVNVRPNVFLCLVSLLVIEALVTTLQPQHLDSVYRTFRLAEFLATLWLLTPWWGRRDLLLVRYHLASLCVVLGSVVLGLLVAPGHAFFEGRLNGALWEIPATQVAHYAAVAVGLVVVLWLGGQASGRSTLAAVVIGGTMLVLTHTRTALAALITGVLVAGLSLIAVRARARRFLAGVGVIVSIAIVTLGSFISTWLARGESNYELFSLTGRTDVWGPLLAFPRDRFQELFGFGLSNDSFNGQAFDSNWLAAYQAQGLVGVVICATMLVFLFAAAYFQPRGVQRALALFLLTYALIASFTEVGFSGASVYLLEVCLAASLLVPGTSS
jgi:hypothetical protein